MEKLNKTLKDKGVMVSDGAWGTMLQNMGLKAGDCPELWNDSHPENVLMVALAYVNAGAGMIKTNSFGGSRIKLAHYGLHGRTTELNRKAAQISRQAAGENIHVLGSIGPTGKILMMGDTTEEDLYENFAEQAKALWEGGADIILIETMSDLDEATIAIRATKENTHAEIACTMTFNKTIDNEYRTMMGVSPYEMVPALVEAGADIIGANCGNGMENMIGLVTIIRAANPQIPILIHANAGMPEILNGKTIYNETPEQTASYVKHLVKAGVNIIGGCCGTTPKHIEKIKEKLSDMRIPGWVA